MTSADDNVRPSFAWFLYLVSPLDEPPEEITIRNESLVIRVSGGLLSLVIGYGDNSECENSFYNKTVCF